MAEQPRGGGGDTNSGMGPVWIVAGLMVLAFVVWHFAHAQISSFVLAIRKGEALLLSLFTSSVDPAIEWINNADPAAMTMHQLMTVSGVVGHYLSFPVAILLIALAAVLYFGNVKLRFQTVYGMKDFIQLESVNWPQIMPVLHLDLINQDIDKGPWAMSIQPMTFAKNKKLLEVTLAEPEPGKIKAKTKYKATLQRGEAMQEFILQIGPYWQGAERLPIHARALFAVFAARAAHDLDAASALLTQISISAATGKLDFSGTDQLLNKYQNEKLVVDTVRKHAFVMTVMASMLQISRNDGVMASADFIWLKPVDRALWLMLNNVGRKTAFVEVAGPWAHWQAEIAMDRPLFVAMVDKAVNGLEEAIKQVVYLPDNDAEAEAIEANYRAEQSARAQKQNDSAADDESTDGNAVA